MASKALAAGLAKERWNELTQDVILSAWNFDEADGNDEADDRGNSDDEDALINGEYGHDDLEEADLIMMTSSAADRDDRDDHDG
jgi:hypothetical protein